MSSSKISAVIRLLRLDGPVVPLLIVWSCLWGLWLAGQGQPPARLVFIFLLGSYLSHAAGCVFNDIADRHFDGRVERTRNRPLATGEIGVGTALALGLGLLALNLLLALQLNGATLALVGVAGLLLLGYPYCKRFFLVPQLVLGMALALPVLLTSTAVLGRISGPALLFYGAGICWTLVYDTFYALVDRNDDRRIGLHSSALWVEGRELPFLAGMMGLMLLLLLLGGWVAGLGGWYHVGLGAAALLLAWELYSVRQFDREACFRAFLHSNWVGAAVWAGLVLNFL